MARGNVENLRKAAQAKHAAAIKRAEQGLRRLLKNAEPITFEGVAAAGGVSKDFLYRTPDLRDRIQTLRARQAPVSTRPAPVPAPDPGRVPDTSSIIRTLTGKLTEERTRNRQRITELETALAAAHGQILTLQRQQGSRPWTPDPDTG
ncbi:DUF6262 family protein [Arthrobacter sp. efr-133-R2A-63]|uniref:DUF6262 family protein n=1 Tax=Arthrobacter sp. efr-133-R2A-63 TaxID=3040278 RepID=UPI00254FB122|nr:DUF6262 family protein [Arthrobacter sp. efr-133-R2A-63]